MKRILVSLCIALSLFGAKIIQPDKHYSVDGAVLDMVYKDKKMYVATDASVVDVLDTQNGKILQKIKLPQIKNFMGDVINAKAYSVDVFGSNVLILSQGENGFRRLDLYDGKELKQIIGASDKLYIAKAKFIDDTKILFGLLGNDIILYDTKTHKKLWTLQASQSKFSNFALNEDKSKVVVCDESGDLHIISITDGKLLKTLSGENLDNVFQVDYKNKTIATAGQDRRVVVYDLRFHSAYYKTSSFLIYSVGLSPSAKLVAYASDEDNHVSVFKKSTKSTVGVFGGNAMIISKILFINEKEFFVASDDKIINYYKIK